MAGEDDETMFRAGLAPGEGTSPAGIPHVGAVIAEKYQVESILGVGGMGVVLAVRHLELGETYAIKCLLPRGAAEPETVERFMREAKAAVRIASEHIVRVSDVGRLEGGAPYMLMEHLIGRDLSKVLSEHGRLSVRDAVEYVLQACTGIAEAHALGIVHRDLKPANIFLTQRRDGPPLVKVLDFGISKAMEEGGPHNPSLTQTASVFGSPAYMSPEQIRSAKNVDYRTDVWSLGVILYELLSGQMPFKAETSGGLLSAIAADEPLPLRAVCTDALEITADLEAVVMRCLAKKVGARYQSVSELATALEPFSGPSSLVSVGRIRRLSVPASSRHPHLGSASSRASDRSGPAAGAGIGIATASAWSTGDTDAGRTRKLTALVVVAVLASLLVGGLYVARRAASSDVRAAATDLGPSSAVASVSPAPPAPALTTTPSAASAAAMASESALIVTATAAAPASAGARGGRLAHPVQPKSTRSTGTTSVGAAPAPPPVTAPGVSVDPTKDSH